MQASYTNIKHPGSTIKTRKRNRLERTEIENIPKQLEPVHEPNHQQIKIRTKPGSF